MMLFDRKKSLSQIMGPPPDSPTGDNEVDKDNPLHHLAKEAIDAVHAKDHKGFAEAFKAMHLACGGMIDGQAEDDEPTGYHE